MVCVRACVCVCFELRWEVIVRFADVYRCLCVLFITTEILDIFTSSKRKPWRVIKQNQYTFLSTFFSELNCHWHINIYIQYIIYITSCNPLMQNSCFRKHLCKWCSRQRRSIQKKKKKKKTTDTADYHLNLNRPLPK